MPPTATKKPKTKQSPLTVTIRQVENTSPCSSSDYFDCLDLLKSSPVPAGPYASSSRRKFPKKPRYGPDDPIPLVELANILPDDAIQYLVDRFLPQQLRSSIMDRADEISHDSYLMAVREILSKTPKKKAKSNVKSKSTTR